MKRITIPASPTHPDRRKRFAREITIILGDEIEKEYEVIAKDFPDNLPEIWVDPDDKREKKIEWFSNFGLRKPNGEFAVKLPKGQRYKIELAAQPGTIVYFDGKRVQKLPGTVRGQKFIAELDLGDPPVGKTVG